jgi:hypothetical protein
MAARILTAKHGQTIAALRGLLAFAVARKFDDTSTTALWGALVKPSSVTRAFLKDLLRSPRESERLLAFEHLGEGLSAKGASALWTLAKSDLSPAIRILYLKHIAYSEVHDRIVELKAQLRDPVAKVRVEAVRLLIGIETRGALVAAASFMGDPDDQVAEVASIAAEGLARLNPRD